MSNLIPGFATKTFTEIYETVNDFCYDYQHVGIPTTILVNNAMTLYYLLYAKYGNTPIANWDENQFKYKLFGVIFQYGPTWEKRLDIQTKLRNLTETELLSGAKTIYNHAYNPETEPKTGDITELNYINEQNTQNFVKNKLNAYSELMSLLETDVTGEFLDRFNICFKKFARPGTYLYVEDEDNEA